MEYEIEMDSAILSSIETGGVRFELTVGDAVGIAFEPEHFRIFRKRSA